MRLGQLDPSLKNARPVLSHRVALTSVRSRGVCFPSGGGVAHPGDDVVIDARAVLAPTVGVQGHPRWVFVVNGSSAVTTGSGAQPKMRASCPPTRWIRRHPGLGDRDSHRRLRK